VGPGVSVPVGVTGLPLALVRMDLCAALPAPSVRPSARAPVMGTAVSPVPAVPVVTPLRRVTVTALTRITGGGALLRRRPGRLAGARGRILRP